MLATWLLAWREHRRTYNLYYKYIRIWTYHVGTFLYLLHANNRATSGSEFASLYRKCMAVVNDNWWWWFCEWTVAFVEHTSKCDSIFKDGWNIQLVLMFLSVTLQMGMREQPADFVTAMWRRGAYIRGRIRGFAIYS